MRRWQQLGEQELDSEALVPVEELSTRVLKTLAESPEICAADGRRALEDASEVGNQIPHLEQIWDQLGGTADVV
jgi:hypothetical protein